MEPAQTAVLDYPPVAIAGMWGGGPNSGQDCMTRIAEIALNAGLVVVGGTDPENQCARPDALADLNEAAEALVNAGAGVVLHEHRGTAGDAYLFAIGDAVNVVRKGRIWMKTETALVRGTHPFVRCVVTGSEEAGILRNDVDGTDAVQVQWLTVVRSVGAAGLVEVDVHLPIGPRGATGATGATGPAGP